MDRIDKEHGGALERRVWMATVGHLSWKWRLALVVLAIYGGSIFAVDHWTDLIWHFLIALFWIHLAIAAVALVVWRIDAIVMTCPRCGSRYGQVGTKGICYAYRCQGCGHECLGGMVDSGP